MNNLNIYQRMLKATEEIGVVAKNLNVEIGKGKGYKAVSERDIIDAVKPIETKHGIYSYPISRTVIENGVIENERNGYVTKNMYLRLEVVYRFVNVDNPNEFVEITTYGDGLDSGDKATGKAMTYADKYALMKAYKISTGDDTDQEASAELKGATTKPNTKLITDVQKKMILQAYADKPNKFNELLDKLGLKTLDDMPLTTASSVIKAIKEKESK